MEDKKIVLLIDAENTSAKYADCIMHYLEKQGIIISARIYGDFINNNNVKGWNSKAIQYEMEQKQQLTTSAGKNASDIALVIDAMDLLYLKTIDTFCLVTSDGDFTNLVKRIREDGIEVIGIGKADASKRLGKVCDTYLEFEQLMEKTKEKADNPTEKNPAKNKKAESKKAESKKTDGKNAGQVKSDQRKSEPEKTVEPLKNIKMTLNELVQQDENAGKYADLGGIKSRLQLKYPGFDEKDYGYKSIRELIDNETKFEVYQDERHTYVHSSKKNTAKDLSENLEESVELENVCRFLLDHFPKKVIGVHEMGAFGKKLHNAFPEFSYKEYGYGKLSAFLEEVGFKIY